MAPGQHRWAMELQEYFCFPTPKNFPAVFSKGNCVINCSKFKIIHRLALRTCVKFRGQCMADPAAAPSLPQFEAAVKEGWEAPELKSATGTARPIFRAFKK